jgi:hypothetical protein
VIDWIEKARRRLGLDEARLDPDYLPPFGEDEAKSLVEKIYASKGKTDKTIQNPKLTQPEGERVTPEVASEVVPICDLEITVYSENRTDKTDETAETTDLPSRSELTKLTKPPQEDHRALLEVAARARPPDVKDAHWEAALRGLEVFLEAGRDAEAERLGWSGDELYAVPPLWSRVDLCGVALLIGDREVIGITANEIRIKTASGSSLAFYRKPQVDYGVAYRARIKMAGEDARKEGREEEVKLHALEAVARLYVSHHSGADIDTAKAAVLAAIKEAAP